MHVVRYQHHSAAVPCQKLHSVRALERNTNTSPGYGFARSASLTGADNVFTDLRKSTGCAAITTLRSPAARSPVGSQRRQHRRKRRRIDTRLDPDARPAHLDLDHPAPGLVAIHLDGPVSPPRAARLACRRRTTLGSDPNRHKACRLDAYRRCQLVSPHREQPADNAMSARHLGNVSALLEALRYDPGLPLAPSTVAGGAAW